jgi:elongation factor 2
VNVVISTYESEDSGISLQVDPTEGNIAFGAALFGWAFTLDKFARIYSEKFNIDKKVLVKKLWGDNYYDPEKKCFVTTEETEDGRKLPRAFVQFIMDPIIKLMKNIMENKIEAVFKMVTSLGIKLSEQEK